MKDAWCKIELFPDYSVSKTGLVRNDVTGRHMAQLVNQHGVVHVGLTRDKRQYKRSVTVLVAEAFITRPSFSFDTPINLDGDRYNNTIENLMWRPRWFAVRYFRQFLRRSAPSITRPVEIVKTGEQFPNSWEAATTLGILDSEVATSILEKTYVWPLYKKFQLVRM